MRGFWSRTEDKSYIGFKRKPADGHDTVPKKPRYTSTPLKVGWMLVVPLSQEVRLPNIENKFWDTVLLQLETLAPTLSTVLKSSITRKANQETLVRGKHVNLKPQLGTAVASLPHINILRPHGKLALYQLFFSIQFWRGGLKRETFKQLSHTGICVRYDKTLDCVDKISSDFDKAAKKYKTLIEE